MEILKFEYIYNEYATTNPPRSVSVAYTLESFTEDSVKLDYLYYYNGNKNEKKFTITDPEYSKITAFIQNDRIVEAIEKQCKNGQNRPPETMAMCGGSTSRGINITKASGEELSTLVIPENANKLIWYLADLVKENQAPAAADNKWFCSNCGAPNEGNFCTNCGNKR